MKRLLTTSLLFAASLFGAEEVVLLPQGGWRLCPAIIETCLPDGAVAPWVLKVKTDNPYVVAYSYVITYYPYGSTEPLTKAGVFLRKDNDEGYTVIPDIPLGKSNVNSVVVTLLTAASTKNLIVGPFPMQKSATLPIVYLRSEH